MDQMNRWKDVFIDKTIQWTDMFNFLTTLLIGTCALLALNFCFGIGELHANMFFLSCYFICSIKYWPYSDCYIWNTVGCKQALFIVFDTCILWKVVNSTAAFFAVYFSDLSKLTHKNPNKKKLKNNLKILKCEFFCILQRCTLNAKIVEKLMIRIMETIIIGMWNA